MRFHSSARTAKRCTGWCALKCRQVVIGHWNVGAAAGRSKPATGNSPSSIFRVSVRSAGGPMQKLRLSESRGQGGLEKKQLVAIVSVSRHVDKAQLASSGMSSLAFVRSVLEDQHAHCLSVKRGDVLDATAAAPPQLCGTGMAQVSVRGVRGHGSERLRAEASRLRRPTRGRVVLRAASSFLPAQLSAPILFGLWVQICQASRRDAAPNERDPVCLED